MRSPTRFTYFTGVESSSIRMMLTRFRLSSECAADQDRMS
jgi:hypothetical protein